jgi:hypothetical protein
MACCVCFLLQDVANAAMFLLTSFNKFKNDVLSKAFTVPCVVFAFVVSALPVCAGVCQCQARRETSVGIYFVDNLKSNMQQFGADLHLDRKMRTKKISECFRQCNECGHCDRSD